MIAEHEKRIHFLALPFKICIGVREHFLYPKSKVLSAIARLQKTFRHQSLRWIKRLGSNYIFFSVFVTECITVKVALCGN